MNEIHLLNRNLQFRLTKKNNEYVLQYRLEYSVKKKRECWYNIFENNYEYKQTDWTDVPTVNIDETLHSSSG